MRKRWLAVPIVVAALATPASAGAGPIKDCGSESDSPSNGWTTDTKQKGSCQSSHEPDTTVTNPGGKTPPGKQ